MAEVATPQDSNETITVHVPLAFRRRGGRKTISHPSGAAALVAPRPTQTNSPLIKALGRAFRWRRLIESRSYATIQEIADAETVNPSYVSRVMRLTLLAPEIVETILDGRQDPALTLDALLKPFPLDWGEQRRFFIDETGVKR